MGSPEPGTWVLPRRLQKGNRSMMDSSVSRETPPADAAAVIAVCKELRPALKKAILGFYVPPGGDGHGCPKILNGRRFDCAAFAETAPEYVDETLGSVLGKLLIPTRGWATNSGVESSHQSGWREQPKKMPVAGGAPEFFNSMKIGVFSHSANSKLRLMREEAKEAKQTFNAMAPREKWLQMMGDRSVTNSPVLFEGVRRRLRSHAKHNLNQSDYWLRNKHKINTKKNQKEIDTTEATMQESTSKLAAYRKTMSGVVEVDHLDVLASENEVSASENEGGEDDSNASDDDEGCYKGAASEALYDGGLNAALASVGLIPETPEPTCAPVPPTPSSATALPPERKRRRTSPALPKPSRGVAALPARPKRTLVAAGRALVGEAARDTAGKAQKTGGGTGSQPRASKNKTKKKKKQG